MASTQESTAGSKRQQEAPSQHGRQEAAKRHRVNAGQHRGEREALLNPALQPARDTHCLPHCCRPPAHAPCCRKHDHGVVACSFQLLDLCQQDRQTRSREGEGGTREGQGRDKGGGRREETGCRRLSSSERLEQCHASEQGRQGTRRGKEQTQRRKRRDRDTGQTETRRRPEPSLPHRLRSTSTRTHASTRGGRARRRTWSISMHADILLGTPTTVSTCHGSITSRPSVEPSDKLP